MTTKQRERVHSLVGGFAVALLVGGFPARQAAARTCLGGEAARMVEPVVELINGPGDLLEEQMWWGEADVVLLEDGRMRITLDDTITGYELTRIP